MLSASDANRQALRAMPENINDDMAKATIDQTEFLNGSSIRHTDEITR